MIINKFKTDKLEIPKLELSIGEWITIVFPNSNYSDEYSIREKYVNSFKSEDVLDLRPWVAFDIEEGEKYSDFIKKIIINSIGEKKHLLIGPLSQPEEFYVFLESVKDKFGIIEFFHSGNFDVKISKERVVVDLSNGLFDGQYTIKKDESINW